MSRSRTMTVLTTVTVLVASPLSEATDAAPAPSGLCGAQQEAARQIEASIEAHNARAASVPKTSAAAVAAYNAEADSLDAQKEAVSSRLTSCIEAMTALKYDGEGAAALKNPQQRTLQKLEKAQKKLPGTWKPSPSPTSPRQNWKVDKNSPERFLYNVLRKGNPGRVGDATLQNTPRPGINDPDPAYAGTGQVIGKNRYGNPAVQPDHIVPLAELLYIKGFTKLNARNMYAVARSPVNLQWMSSKANATKQSRSAAVISGANEKWLKEQIALEQSTRAKLQDIIEKLLKSQET